MNTNLWEEIIETLNDNEKDWEDVKWVGSEDVWIEKDVFEEVAKNTIYDDGYGGSEVAEDLKVVGDNWWLERWEYDGSEGWDFREKLVKPERMLNSPFKLASSGWETALEKINTKEED